MSNDDKYNTCPKCGNVVAKHVSQCPVCGTLIIEGDAGCGIIILIIVFALWWGASRFVSWIDDSFNSGSWFSEHAVHESAPHEMHAPSISPVELAEQQERERRAWEAQERREWEAQERLAREAQERLAREAQERLAREARDRELEIRDALAHRKFHIAVKFFSEGNLAASKKWLDQTAAEFPDTPTGKQAGRMLEGSYILAMQQIIKEANDSGNELSIGLESRDWSDVTGSYSVHAAFVCLANDMVTLVKLNGDSIDVPLAKLSEADRDWIMAQTPRRQ